MTLIVTVVYNDEEAKKPNNSNQNFEFIDYNLSVVQL